MTTATKRVVSERRMQRLGSKVALAPGELDLNQVWFHLQLQWDDFINFFIWTSLLIQRKTKMSRLVCKLWCFWKQCRIACPLQDQKVSSQSGLPGHPESERNLQNSSCSNVSCTIFLMCVLLVLKKVKFLPTKRAHRKECWLKFTQTGLFLVLSKGFWWVCRLQFCLAQQILRLSSIGEHETPRALHEQCARGKAWFDAFAFLRECREKTPAIRKFEFADYTSECEPTGDRLKNLAHPCKEGIKDHSEPVFRVPSAFTATSRKRIKNNLAVRTAKNSHEDRQRYIYSGAQIQMKCFHCWVYSHAAFIPYAICNRGVLQAKQWIKSLTTILYTTGPLRTLFLFNPLLGIFLVKGESV